MREANEGWAAYVGDLVAQRFDGNQSALAQAAGVASSTVTRWIDGATPQIGALLSMCEALDIPMPELLLAAGALRKQDLTEGQVVAPSETVDAITSVTDAIKRDTDLLEEARTHLLAQYELLRRVAPKQSDGPGRKTASRRVGSPSGAEPPLRAVARGGDPKDRAEVRKIAKRAREEHERDKR